MKNIFLFLIFFNLSCTHFMSTLRPDDFVKVTTTESNDSKEKAMNGAYKKALIKIDQLGCDQDKGKGNVIHKMIGHHYIAEATYVVSKEFCKDVVSCKDLEWISDPTRTQGGGWVWFTGKGVADDRIKADELAKKEAIHHLSSECRSSYRNVRFIERCEDYTSSAFVVITRAAIESKDCY